MTYGTLVVDPPWRINRPNGWGRGTSASTTYMPYPLLSVEAIASMPIPGLGAEVSHLYLWTVSRYVEDAYRLVRAWGYTPASLLTWTKNPRGMGPGGHYASTTEFILFARRGIGERNPAVRSPTSWWNWQRRGHSVKPGEFYTIAERISPAPRLDVFARQRRRGWDAWGDEMPDTVPALDEWAKTQENLRGRVRS